MSRARARAAASVADVVASKQDRALALHLAEKSYDEIAEQVGYSSRSGAFYAVHRALRAHAQDAEEQIKLTRNDLIGYHLDQIATWSPVARIGRGDLALKATTEIRHSLAEIAKLMGAYAPVRAETTITAQVDLATSEQRAERASRVLASLAGYAERLPPSERGEPRSTPTAGESAVTSTDDGNGPSLTSEHPQETT